MSWEPKSTKGVGLTEPHKVLLYGHHGWGKTWQVRNLQKRYGHGLLLSGEKGLKSLSDADIPHVPFTSWDGPHDPANDIFSFRGIASYISSPAFRTAGYNWLALDSLTELSEMVYAWAQKETEGTKNGFALWDLYGQKMIGTLKWIRDLPVHVYVTSLAAESSDDNSNSDYWPHVKGNKVAKQIPAIFDHVFCAIRKDVVVGDEVQTQRFIVTEQMHGWHGKVRDPYHRIKSVEETNDITELLDRIGRTPEQEAEVKKLAAKLERDKAELDKVMAEKAAATS